MEVTTNSSIKLLPSMVSYACSLSRTNNELRSFRSRVRHLRPHCYAYDVVAQSPSLAMLMTWWSSSSSPSPLKWDQNCMASVFKNCCNVVATESTSIYCGRQASGVV
ncbi:hypothetical protein C4D60_Mb05t23860 [Musa balbisiana]|uniref:Uncharacterized protein n=1 Tax=Musa balbisiana TaxID=52838 RepID=A0A4S8JYG3_MUSBA|nr:hypothetical protein C4D60_Mb05t23860 [Musa balbisiana]